MSSLLPFLTHLLHIMEQQGTIKFSQKDRRNLGFLRPIVAQRAARYEVTNKCVGPIGNCQPIYKAINFSNF